MFTKLAYIYGMKYLNGKIYKLIDNTNGNIYIGSTCNSLKKRLKIHLNHYYEYKKKDGKCLTTVAYHIIKNNDYKMELLENFPCKTKQELLNKEREYIENNKCININKPITTYQEKLDYGKEYRDKNRDKLLEQKKEYWIKNRDKLVEKKKEYWIKNKDKLAEKSKKKYEDNKQDILKKCKEYRDKNRDKLLEKKKIYSEANKDKIKERRSEKIQCDNCSSTICIGDLAKHKRTLKCQNYKKDL
jgi:hypothetical protein